MPNHERSIGIENVRPTFGEHGGDDRFAAGDAAREADNDGQCRLPENTNAPCAGARFIMGETDSRGQARSAHCMVAHVFEHIDAKTCGVAMIVDGCR